MLKYDSKLIYLYKVIIFFLKRKIIIYIGLHITLFFFNNNHIKI